MLGKYMISDARSIDKSVVLERVISSSIKSHNPVIIVINPQKSLTADLDLGGDGTTNKSFEDDNDTNLSSSLRSHNHNVESCKQFLRQQLNGKCSDQADCSEVVWEIADLVCDDVNDKEQPLDKIDKDKVTTDPTTEPSISPGLNGSSTRAPQQLNREP